MQKKIRVAIAGGTGYTGGELFRILLNHPYVEIVAATTTSSEGTPVASVHRDLIGETDLCFGFELNDPDVIFLCLGHGISRQFVDTHDIKPECRIIDLGNDFRLDGDYAGRHFVYGLCESAREAVRSAHDVANHRIDRSRKEAGRNYPLQLSQRQYLNLQALHPPASCRDKAESCQGIST